jgi:hypothetical protein
VEYMGMAGCWREACDLGAMIVVMLKCIGYYSGVSILSIGMHMLPYHIVTSFYLLCITSHAI